MKLETTPFEHISRLIKNSSSMHKAEYWYGFLNACGVYDIINLEEWGELYDLIQKKEKNDASSKSK